MRCQEPACSIYHQSRQLEVEDNGLLKAATGPHASWRLMKHMSVLTHLGIYTSSSVLEKTGASLKVTQTMLWLTGTWVPGSGLPLGRLSRG